MNNREITLWLDERWIKALEEHSSGKRIEEIMQVHLDKLVQTLPDKVRESISAEIRAEDKARIAQQEADRRFSLVRFTEQGETNTRLVEPGEGLFSTALRLRRHLRGENSLPELYPAAAELTQNRAEQYVAEAVNGSPRVVGVYDIDLDKGEFSMLDINYGWRTYSVKDISTAVYHAMKKESADWVEKRNRFYEQVEGMDCNPTIRPVFIRGEKPLPMEAVGFESDISEMDGRFLNFYIPVHFDPDAVFGAHVGTDENDDSVNVYANYDMATGSVKDNLDVTLVRGDGTELCCQYRLTPEEQTALQSKMDAYCQEQLGITLEEARAEYLEEQQQTATLSPSLLSQAEHDRQEMHREVDARYDALVRRAVLGDKSGSGRLVPMRDDLSSLKGEKPFAVILPNGSAVPVKTWRQAAQAIMRDCCADPERRERLMELRGKLHGNLRTILSDKPDGMDVPLEISEGLYMEGKFDTGALLRMLTEKVLPQAGYDYQGTLLQLREPEVEQGQEQAPTQGMSQMM